MKIKLKPTESENLAAWLIDPRCAEFFGPLFNIRADALAHVLNRKGTVRKLAAKHGVSRQAMTEHITAAMEIFGRRR